MSTAQPGLSRIRQIAVTVRDLDRAVEFYRDALGIPFLFHAPPGMAFFDCDGTRLMLGLPEGDAPDLHASILYFAVDDIEAVHEALVGRGVSFVEPPRKVAELPDHDLWLGFFRDSEDNTMAVISEVPRDSSSAD